MWLHSRWCIRDSKAEKRHKMPHKYSEKNHTPSVSKHHSSKNRVIGGPKGTAVAYARVTPHLCLIGSECLAVPTTHAC